MSETLNLVDATSVKTSFLDPHKKFPLLVEPITEGFDLYSWLAIHQEDVISQILHYGGILFRNFNVEGASDLDKLIRIIADEPLEYRERSSPRSSVAGKIYTSTEYAAHQAIALHCENSYQESWPMRIFFHCVTPATTGGETPIADTRRVFHRLNPELRQQFIDKKVMYIRNFYQYMELTWQKVFQTNDKAEVVEYCQKNQIQIEWREDESLRTRVVREPVLQHPQTKEYVWFNHAMFFHISTLEQRLRDGLLTLYKQDELPANSFYGDGTPIPDTIIEEIRQAYAAETVLVPWKKGDVLLLDNMLVAHGRNPYSGTRQVLVGMAEPINRTLLEAQ